MTQNFTPAQKKAIDSNAPDICVKAGAGSGKTGVLVARFVRIVEENLAAGNSLNSRSGIDEILVLTFTNRAAREMKTRIANAFDLTRRTALRREIDSAHISTVHSMCSRILRAHPMEANIDPAFSVIEDVEARLLINQAFKDELSAGGGGPAAYDLLNTIIENTGINASDLDAFPVLEHELSMMIRKMQACGGSPATVRQLAASEPKHGADRNNAALILLPALRELAECLQKLRTVPVSTSSGRSAVKTLIDEAALLIPGADMVGHIQNIIRFHNAARACVAALSSQHANAGIAAILQRIEAACSSVSYLFGVTMATEEASRKACARFLVMLAAVWERYEDTKRKHGVLDHDDLLLKCIHLFEEHPGIRDDYRKRFRHVLVDEFQDTDPLQKGVLDLLHDTSHNTRRAAAAKKQATNVTHNCMFVVGDSRQSIYGFRNADPEIFTALDAELRSTSDAECIQLDENHRSRPEIIAFINQVFHEVSTALAAPFAKIKPAGDFEVASGPSVEMLVSTNLARRDYIASEAACIARRIRDIVLESDQHITIGSRRSTRCGMAASYSDFAILLRGMTDLSVYQGALESLGIPVAPAVGGSDYLYGVETQDLLAFLKLLDSPLDEIALLTVLRSPFVGATFDTLYLLAMEARDTADYQSRSRPLVTAIPALLASPHLPSCQKEKLEPFLEARSKLQRDVDQVPVGLLIDRLIRYTNYDMRLVCRPNGKRKLANVRRLLQIALESPSSTLCEFLKRIDDLCSIYEHERITPSADPVPNAVTIMTIHSAKGLEFPVVVIPDLSHGISSTNPSLFVFDPNTGSMGTRVVGEPDANYIAISRERQASERSEFVRLLYVAMTRACEHLILCGNIGRNRGLNWADLVFEAVGLTTCPETPTSMELSGGVEALVSPIAASAGLAADEPDVEAVIAGLHRLRSGGEFEV